MTAQEHVARVVAELAEWRTVREIAVRTDLRIQTVRWAIQQHARTSVLVCRRRANQAREYRICPEAVGVEVVSKRRLMRELWTTGNAPSSRTASTD